MKTEDGGFQSGNGEVDNGVIDVKEGWLFSKLRFRTVRRRSLERMILVLLVL